MNMYDNNFNNESEIESLIEKKNTSNEFLKDLIVDFEEQLYSVKLQLKVQINLLNSKEHELDEIERTKVHNLDLFSPIYNKTYNTTEIISKIEQIKQHISILNENQQSIAKKITGLKETLNCINTIDKKCEESKIEVEDNKHISADKGLGILEAQEIERQRIARDLHDSTVQNLTGLVHKSELCVKLIDIDSMRAKLELYSMSNTLKMVINDMRGIIYNLKPMTLDDLGLTITIQRLANRIMNVNNIQVKVITNEETKEILPVIKLTLFRLIQEACNNIVKHAKASIINIDINYDDHRIKVIVKDNGIGFDVNKPISSNSDQLSSFGLSNMKERISLLSGSLDITSEEKIGTSVTISVPLIAYEEEEDD